MDSLPVCCGQEIDDSVYRLIYFPNFICGKGIVDTSRTGLPLKRVWTPLAIRDEMVIWNGLRMEPLCLHAERSHWRWYGHLTRMLPGQLLGEVFWAPPVKRRPRSRRRTQPGCDWLYAIFFFFDDINYLINFYYYLLGFSSW